ncbi:uracil-DNA glycosylase [Plasticicumulans acidivorans]|uniref:Type-4 uracil-DNA glycosylase n=1 Tax=Plasticicumulans acidivorans TaxID=886464 RepID=A0A317MZS5_9GAMM|nr:uracil-DNA glycosylase [Plasticicumulans acidivorans]PWV65812.1 DNA polymerase [Plasticicumulans acidivorans]
MSERHRRYLEALGIPLWLARRPLAGSATAPAAEPDALQVAATVADSPAAASAAEAVSIEMPVPAVPVVMAQVTPPVASAVEAVAGSAEPPVAADMPTDAGGDIASDDWAPFAPPDADADYAYLGAAADFDDAAFAGDVDAGPVSAGAAPIDDRRARIARMDWDELAEAVRGCTACPLCESRRQTVFGVGRHDAAWMIVGEAPGRDEDLQGEPFVGQAGQLLNEMLFAVGRRRDDVFIANVLKCRPPNNRDPLPAEVVACKPFLDRQLALVRPRLVLSVGRISAQNLLGSDAPVGKLRGRVHRYGEVPLVVTYHPAYLLRSPAEKRRSWDDLELALAAAAGDEEAG